MVKKKTIENNIAFVAGPCWSDISKERELNIVQAEKTGIMLLRLGWYPFIPHKMTAGFEVYEISETVYRNMYLKMMELMVPGILVLLPGSQISDGAKKEIELFETFYSPPFRSRRIFSVVDEVVPFEHFDSYLKTGG